jgi:hypothetical protein
MILLLLCISINFGCHQSQPRLRARGKCLLLSPVILNLNGSSSLEKITQLLLEHKISPSNISPNMAGDRQYAHISQHRLSKFWYEKSVFLPSHSNLCPWPLNTYSQPMFSVNQWHLHDYSSVFITSLFLSVTFAYISVVMHLHDSTCHPLIFFFLEKWFQRAIPASCPEQWAKSDQYFFFSEFLN